MEAELTEEERRKEALRKAGQEYFENGNPHPRSLFAV
jgi:hypothetical protein